MTGYTSTVTSSTITGSANDIWIVWAGDSGTTATTDMVWPTWVRVSGTITSSATTVIDVWPQWVAVNNSGAVTIRGRPQQAARQLTEADRLHAERENERLRKVVAEERALRVAAEERAEKLLQSVLNPEQRETLAKKNCFYVHVGDKRYRVDRGSHGNVKLVNERDEIIESLCVQPAGVPVADVMAAQKLMLEACPEKLRKVANITDRRSGRVIHGAPLAVGEM